MIKALGTFGYQTTTLDEKRYLEAVPRTLERLERHLPRYAETSRLGELLQDCAFLSP